MSAKDCAHIALNSFGSPTINEMFISSLEKKIRDVMKEKADMV